MRDLTVHCSLLCLIPAALQAQANPGSDILTGRVTDLTGRPVAEAQVGATSRRTGVTRSNVTDVEGRYKIYFPETAPEYTLLVKRMGFSPVQRKITRGRRNPHGGQRRDDAGGSSAPIRRTPWTEQNNPCGRSSG